MSHNPAPLALHSVPSTGSNPSAGQVAPLYRSQDSLLCHIIPADALHSVVTGSNYHQPGRSAPLYRSQDSLLCHIIPHHWPCIQLVAGSNPSAGQVAVASGTILCYVTRIPQTPCTPVLAGSKSHAPAPSQKPVKHASASKHSPLVSSEAV